MPTFDFDFQRYVERKKGAREAERREGAGYAYAGDLRIRRLLDRARPVTMALEATVRLWRGSARAELLGTALKVTGESQPRVHRAVLRAAELLHVAVPPVHLSPHLLLSVHTFGTDDEPQIVLHAGLADSLSDDELLHTLGAELGRIQNNHVLLATAHYYLLRAGSTFVRWIVKPAVASLDLWSRRALVTVDRAGLLSSRNLAASSQAIGKLAAASLQPVPSVDHEPIADDEPPLPGMPPHDPDIDPDEVVALDVARRAAALEVFSRSAYYRGVVGETGGLSAEDTDAQTATALKTTPKRGG